MITTKIAAKINASLMINGSPAMLVKTNESAKLMSSDQMMVIMYLIIGTPHFNRYTLLLNKSYVT